MTGRKPYYYYILNDDHSVSPTEDINEYEKNLESKTRLIKQETVSGLWVSTVFLGIDHAFGDGLPLLFETMVFPKDSWSELYGERCSTYEEAIEMHERAILWARSRGEG